MASLYTRTNDAFFSVKRHLMEVQRASAHHRSNSSDRRRVVRRLETEDLVSDFELQDKDDGSIWSDLEDEELNDAGLLQGIAFGDTR